MIRCVVAEDEHILRKGLILTTDWKSLGCEIIGEAENGEEALNLIRRLHPDLIITDIRMPILDGLSLIQEVQSFYNPEFIILSGYHDFSYAKTAIRLGVSDYICKPVDEDELNQAIKNVVKKIQNKLKQTVLNPKIEIVNNCNLMLFREYLSDNSTSKNAYIIRAVNYIKDHYQEDISIKDVCKALLISESYLTKLFKEHTSYSFIDYLTNCRMKKACELLNDDTVKIYTIAELVGYKDPRYFSALFKKYVGLTPRQFRERQSV